MLCHGQLPGGPGCLASAWAAAAVQPQAARRACGAQVVAGVGRLLKEAVNLPCCCPELWGLLGRFYAHTGQLESAKEALLKQVGGRARRTRAPVGRSALLFWCYVGGGTEVLWRRWGAVAALRCCVGVGNAVVTLKVLWQHAPPPRLQVRALSGSAAFKSDEARFVEVADASLALASAYTRLHQAGASPAGPAGAAGAGAAKPLAGGARELAAARMHLRGVLKQCQPVFGEHAKWVELEAAAAEVAALEAQAAGS